MAILLMRHGPTALNGEQRVRGLLNIGLSAEGKAIAKDLATKAADYPLVDLKSSDMRRATQTADVVSKQTGVPVTTHQELRPWDLGSLAGQPLDTAMPVIQSLLKHPDTAAPGGGESFTDFSTRLLEFLRADLADDQLHGVMAHGSGATTLETAIAHGLSNSAPPVTKGEASIKPGGMARVTADTFEPLYRESSGGHGIAS